MNVSPAVYAIATLVTTAVLSPVMTGGYGIFVDEFYYVACSERLAWGYVDHPPLAPSILRASREILGDSLLSLRLPPAVAAGFIVLLSGRLAGQLGGGRYAQILASLCAAAAPVFLVISGFFSMNSLRVVWWALAFSLLIEIEQHGRSRLWLAFGALAGIALLNKHTFVLLAASLLVGMLLTRARHHLRSPWLWAGVAIAGLLLSPNLMWQVDHDWPSVEFYRNADRFKNHPTPPFAVLAAQVTSANPVTLPVWIAGLYYLLWAPGGRRLRHLGWIYPVLLLLLMIGGKSRPDRIAPCFVLLFAAGAVHMEAVLTRRRLRQALPVLVTVGAIAMAPLSIPLLPIATAGHYARALGAPQIENKKPAIAPQWFADRMGWPEYVARVREVVEQLPPQQRSTSAIVTTSYGLAGALTYPGYDTGHLPPVHATHNTYHLWGPPAETTEVFVLVGGTRAGIDRLFEQVEHVATSVCDGCTGWRQAVPIRIARRPRRPVADMWPDLRHFR
ncbi:MAG: glycosyltransferase family 39 protein [Myxococcales bacterium]|nr:glycosyltransferase family 39 protein [Myxococcales bacterium]